MTTRHDFDVEMTTEEDSVVPSLTRLYQALGAGDPEGAAACLTEDTVLHVPGRSVNTGTYRGRGEVLGFVASAAEVTGGSLTITVHRVLDDGEWAVALATYTASRPGREAPLENNLAHVARLQDGLVAESWLHSRDQYEVDRFWGVRERADEEVR
jgi:ketosteroid isomerase-like protein